MFFVSSPERNRGVALHVLAVVGSLRLGDRPLLAIRLGGYSALEQLERRAEDRQHGHRRGEAHERAARQGRPEQRRGGREREALNLAAHRRRVVFTSFFT